MTENEKTPDELAAEEHALESLVKRKFIRIVSSMHLHWPEHGLTLHAQDSQRLNEFDQPEDISEGAAKAMRGFIRSGHIKIYVGTVLHGEDVPTFVDVTPTPEDLAEAEAEEAPAGDTGEDDSAKQSVST